jgi:ribonuclease HII
LIAGMDEVGRGPLAGPVVACAVIMPPNVRAIAGVDDSKKLSASDREILARRIRERALALSIGAASAREIDRLNIYHATTLAMRRALVRLLPAPHHVIVDGRPIKALGVEHTAVVGGDGKCYAVACASILAKVTRDGLMRRLAPRYPAYGWEHNAGYGTPYHQRALDSVGTTPHHRRSFCVRQFVLDFDGVRDELLRAEDFDGEPLPNDPDEFDDTDELELVRGVEREETLRSIMGSNEGENRAGRPFEKAGEERSLEGRSNSLPAQPLER